MRYEYKYIIPEYRLDELRNMMDPFVLTDPEAVKTGGEYTVRSIYFDTADFDMYHTKREHLPHRMKVRLRGYNYGNDDSTVFTEIKRKYEGPIVKNRCPAPYGLIKSIFRGASLDEALPQTAKVDNARRFFYQIFSNHLRPVVNVIYEREPMLSRILHPENDCRLTIDKNWRCTAFPGVDELFSDDNIAFALPGYFVLEVKFNLFCPAWIKPILAGLDTQKAPASKYVVCIDAHPDIRPNLRAGRHYSRPFFAREDIK